MRSAMELLAAAGTVSGAGAALRSTAGSEARSPRRPWRGAEPGSPPVRSSPCSSRPLVALDLNLALSVSRIRNRIRP